MTDITALGDLDGDGLALEFAVTYDNYRGNRVDVLWLSEEGILQKSTQLKEGSPHVLPGTSLGSLELADAIAFLGDVDLDGHAREIIVKTSDTRAAGLSVVWLTPEGYAERAFESVRSFRSSNVEIVMLQELRSSRAMVLGNDMNGDGIPNDVIVATERTLFFFAVTADGAVVNVTSTHCTIHFVCDIHGIVRLGDMDGDGLSQEVAVASRHNTLSVAWLDHTGAVIKHMTSTVSTPTWPGITLEATGKGMIQIGSATDLDGDGQALELFVMLGDTTSTHNRHYACAWLTSTGVVSRVKTIHLEPNPTSGLKWHYSSRQYASAGLWTSLSSNSSSSAGAIAFMNAGRFRWGHRNLAVRLDSDASVQSPIRNLVQGNNGLGFIMPDFQSSESEGSIAYVEGISAPDGQNAAIVVGDPYQFLTGVVFIMFMNSTTVEHYQPLTFGLNGVPAEYRQGNDMFGSALGALGDLDHDGSAVELAIGSRTGLIIAWLAPNGTAARTVRLSATAFAQSRVDSLDYIRSICLLGDLDGDGHAGEVALGWSGIQDTSLTLLWLTRNATISKQHRLRPNLDLGTDPNSWRPSKAGFGTSISLVGDANGDGFAHDIVVGALGWDAFWILCLDDSGGLISQWPILRANENACPSTTGNVAGQKYGRLVVSNGRGPGETSDWLNLFILGSNALVGDTPGNTIPQICMQWVNRSGAVSRRRQWWNATTLASPPSILFGSTAVIVPRFPQQSGAGRTLVTVNRYGMQTFTLPQPSQFPSASPTPTASPSPSITPSAAPSPSTLFTPNPPWEAAAAHKATHRCSSHTLNSATSSLLWLGSANGTGNASTVLSVCPSCRLPSHHVAFHHLDSRGCPYRTDGAPVADLVHNTDVRFVAPLKTPLTTYDGADFGHIIIAGFNAVTVAWVAETPKMHFNRSVPLDFSSISDIPGLGRSWTSYSSAAISSMVSLGDTERTGCGIDIMFGMPGWMSTGAVMVYSLRRAGINRCGPSFVKSVIANGLAGISPGSLRSPGLFGARVAHVGQLRSGGPGTEVLVGATHTAVQSSRDGVVYRLRLNASGSVTWIETINSPRTRDHFGLGIASIGREANGVKLAIVASESRFWLLRMPPTESASTVDRSMIMRRGAVSSQSYRGLLSMVVHLPPQSHDGSALLVIGGRNVVDGASEPLYAFRVFTLTLVPTPTPAPTSSASGHIRPSPSSSAATTRDAAADHASANDDGDPVSMALVGALVGGGGLVVIALVAVFVVNRHRHAQDTRQIVQSDTHSESPAAGSQLATRSQSQSQLVTAIGDVRTSAEATIGPSATTRSGGSPHRDVPSDDPNSWERSCWAKVLCETTVLWGVCFRVDLRLCCREWNPATDDLETRIRTARGLAICQVVGVGVGYAVAYWQAVGVLIPLSLLALQSSLKNTAYTTNAAAVLPGPVTMVAKLASLFYLVAAAASATFLIGYICLINGECLDLSQEFVAAFWVGAVMFGIAALMSGTWLGQAADAVHGNIAIEAREAGTSGGSRGRDDDDSGISFDTGNCDDASSSSNRVTARQPRSAAPAVGDARHTSTVPMSGASAAGSIATSEIELTETHVGNNAPHDRPMAAGAEEVSVGADLGHQFAL